MNMRLDYYNDGIYLHIVHTVVKPDNNLLLFLK